MEELARAFMDASLDLFPEARINQLLSGALRFRMAAQNLEVATAYSTAQPPDLTRLLYDQVPSLSNNQTYVRRNTLACSLGQDYYTEILERKATRSYSRYTGIMKRIFRSGYLGISREWVQGTVQASST